MTINIAIAGGGIAGLCLARGLSKYPHLSVTVYEATQRYLDIGGGLAFHGNAMRGLELIDPELLAEYFRRATVMNERDIEMATQVLVGDVQSEDGQPVLLAELGRAKGRKTVARSDLLEGLLSLVPEGVVKSGKRLVQIEERSPKDNAAELGKIILTFKDGTTATADVLISCDGVHSVTRKYLLGADHPAVGLKNHDGWRWVQRSVSAEEVDELNHKLRTYVPILCGHGAYMNSIPTHFGKTLNVSVIQVSKEYRLEENSDEAVQQVADQIHPEEFAHWTKDARDIATLALRDPSTGWRLADHDPAPFYSRGRICMAGDAAHATMPFNGQGAAQSIEDAALLTALFAHVTELGPQAEQALKIYDEIRRPRSQRVAEISRQFGRMYVYAEEGVGEDLNKMRAILGAGAKYTNDVDLQKINEEAVRSFLSAVQ